MFILEQIREPRTGRDLISSKSIGKVEVNDNKVSIEVSLPSLNVAYKSQLGFDIQAKILEFFEDAEVDLHFVETAKEEKARQILPQVKNIIAVASGKGGVGKSTVSVNIAKQLVKLGYKTGLMDADLYGPSIPLLLGLEGQKPKVEKIMGVNKIIPLQKDGLHVISIGFIVAPEQAVVLRGPRLGGIIKQFVTETVWPELDYMIVDLPPGTGDIQLTLVQSVPVTASVIVTSPDELSVADAVKAMNMMMIPNINVPVLGVIENMSYFKAIDTGISYPIFGKGGGKKLADFGQTELIAKLPFLRAMNEAEEETVEKIKEEHFQSLAKNLIEKCNWRNRHLDKTTIVQMER